MKQKLKAKDLEDLIVEAELDIKRKQMNLKNGWAEFKDGMRPGNLVKDMLFSRLKNNGVSNGETGNNVLGSGLPKIAATAAAGFLLNKFVLSKTRGVTKVAAGVILPGIAAMLSKWATKRREKNLRIQNGNS